MRGTTLPAIGLLGTGALAILIWMAGLSWASTDVLTIFGSLDRLTGPFGLSLSWWDRLPEIAAVLGLVALLAAALALRTRSTPRSLTAATTAILALGTAFLAAWLIDPPATAISTARATTPFSWPAYAATAALAVAAGCSIWLTVRSPASSATIRS